MTDVAVAESAPRHGRRPARRAFLFATPVLTGLVIATHPTDPTTAADLGAETGRYIGIHVGLLVMLPLLGIALWLLLQGITGTAATIARVMIPFTVAFYAAFDALIGIGAGVLSREAVALGDPGAEALAARWMEIPMPLPLISTAAVVSWTGTLLAAAVAHYRAGSSWLAVGGLALAGPLFGFGHPLVFGVIGMAALLVAAAAIELGSLRSRRGDGEVERRSQPAGLRTRR